LAIADLEQMIERILAEHRVPKIEELCRIFREVDSDSETSKMAKANVISTLGYGEIGERYPITLADMHAWCGLVPHYLDSKKESGQDYGYTKTVGILLWSSTLNLIARSFTKKNSHMLFDYLQKEWTCRTEKH